jgi:hypothetical protein
MFPLPFNMNSVFFCLLFLVYSSFTCPVNWSYVIFSWTKPAEFVKSVKLLVGCELKTGSKCEISVFWYVCKVTKLFTVVNTTIVVSCCYITAFFGYVSSALRSKILKYWCKLWLQPIFILLHSFWCLYTCYDD